VYIPKIYISTLTLWPRTIAQIESIRTITKLDGLQLVPARRIYFDCLRDYPKDQVIAFKGSFRDPKKKWDPIADIFFRCEGEVETTLHWFKIFFPDAIVIDLPAEKSSLLEVSPVNGGFDYFLHHPHGLVLDTQHIREFKCTRYQKEDFLHQVLEKSITRLLHFQTRSWSELSYFLKNEPTDLELYLRLMMQCQKDVVIELPFYWLLHKPETLLSKIKERILEIATS
jgi:hypothetical protein